LILASESVQTLSDVAAEIGRNFFEDRLFTCITTAAALCETKPWICAEQNCLRALGANVRELDLTGLSSDEVKNALTGTQGIFVHGGNTFYLLQEMQRVEFKKILLPYLEAGGIYIGSSAGTLVLAPRIDLVASADDPSVAPRVDARRGLNLIDFIPFVHFDVPSYRPAFRRSFERAIEEGVNILPLRNDQFLIAEDGCFRLVTAELQS